MSRRLVFVSAIAGTCLGLLGWFLVQAAAIRRAEAEAARVERERAELSQQVTLNRQRAAAAEAERRRLQKVAEDALKSAEVKRGSTVVRFTDPKTAAALEAIAQMPWKDIVVEKSPELQARYLAVRRNDLTALYGPFFANAALTPEQTARFQEIMSAADERALDLKAAMRVNGWTESDPGVATLRNQSEETLHDQEKALLGDEEFHQLADYERALPARGFVNSLAPTFVFAGEPLSGAQANELTQILSEANASYRSGGPAAEPLPDFSTFIFAHQPATETVDADQVLVRARQVLSPSQYTPFEAEINRARTIVNLFNTIRQTPGDPFTGFTIVARK